MKAYVVLINWALSFAALSVDTEKSSLAAVVVVLAWFAISSVLLVRAQRRGVLNNIEKRFKTDDEL